jgi:hypothetical protein
LDRQFSIHIRKQKSATQQKPNKVPVAGNIKIFLQTFSWCEGGINKNLKTPQLKTDKDGKREF